MHESMHREMQTRANVISQGHGFVDAVDHRIRDSLPVADGGTVDVRSLIVLAMIGIVQPGSCYLFLMFMHRLIALDTEKMRCARL